ncbi:unnamed protein product [Fructobacillus fructosus]|nr:unnamed protein product [Fructobacillus fructosus]
MKNDTKKALERKFGDRVQGLNKVIQQDYNILLIEG